MLLGVSDCPHRDDELRIYAFGSKDNKSKARNSEHFLIFKTDSNIFSMFSFSYHLVDLGMVLQRSTQDRKKKRKCFKMIFHGVGRVWVRVTVFAH